MITSLLSHRATDGGDLYAIVSVSAIRSLSPAQVLALATLDIHRVSDLLHFRPIYDASLIVASAKGQIAHDASFADLVDDAFRGLSAVDLISKNPTILKSIDNVMADVFEQAFGISTVQQLADFSAFKEAQQFLTPTEDVFREAESAPSELMPKMVGSVQSTATYSSFVKEETLRLKGIELAYDDTRIHFVDQRLAGLFPVLGFALKRRSPVPEPVLHLGYVCKHTQQWVNFGSFLGEMVYSLALAPGESRNIAIVDWTRSQRTGRSEDTTVSERLTNNLFHARALDEVTRSTAAEHQQGGTTIAAGTVATAAAGVLGAAAAGGIAGTIPGAAIGGIIGAIAGVPTGPGDLVTTLAGAAGGAVVGFGIGASIAGGVALVGAANAQLGTLRSDSSGNRAIEGSLRQSITETISQKSSALRSLRSSIFVMDDQAEKEHLQTRNITNYNHSHMLNLEYFEVLQHYHVDLRLTEAEPLLFLPFRPLDFTFEIIRDFWPTLRRGVASQHFQNKFDRLIDGNESADTAVDTLQKLKALTVELTLNQPLFGELPQVKLTGQPDVQRAKPSLVFMSPSGLGSIGSPVKAIVAFSFNDSHPNFENLTGLSVTGLQDTQHIGITVSIQTEDSTGRAARYSIGDNLVRSTNGIANFPLQKVSGAGQETADAIGEMERYFDERRYFFTRLLLLSVEKEQLIDLVEALQFQISIDIRFPINPPFASGPARVVTVAMQRLTAIRAQISKVLTSEVLRRGVAVFAIKDIIEQIFEMIRSELRRSPPLDDDSVRNAVENIVEKTKDILISTAGLSNGQASKFIRRIKLAEQLRTSLTMAFKISDIAVRNVHLSEFVVPEPLAITGNTLVFRMKNVTDASVLENILVKGKLKPLIDQVLSVEEFVRNSLKNISGHDVYLPTSGMFAEAILGRANSSEKIDLTRFFNWQDSPIPHLAPAIAQLEAGSRARDQADTTPTIPNSVLTIVNPPAFPDPTGMVASLAAVQNGNLFRDMSKTEALTSVLANLSNLANQQSQLASTLAGNAQKEALQSAVSFGNKIADLTAQAQKSQEQPTAPQTLTQQGAVANKLEAIDKKSEITPQDRAVAKAVGAPLLTDDSGKTDKKQFAFQFLSRDVNGRRILGNYLIKVNDHGEELIIANDVTINSSDFITNSVSLLESDDDFPIIVEVTPISNGESTGVSLQGESHFVLPRTKTTVTMVLEMETTTTKIVSTSQSEAKKKLITNIEKRIAGEVGGAGGVDVGGGGENETDAILEKVTLSLTALLKLSGFFKISGSDSRTTTEEGEDTTGGTEVREFSITIPTGGLRISPLA